MNVLKNTVLTIAFYGLATAAVASVNQEPTSPFQESYGLDIDAAAVKAAVEQLEENAGRDLSSQELLEKLGAPFSSLRSLPEYRDLSANEFRLKAVD